jgi:hypothetical protein
MVNYVDVDYEDTTLYDPIGIDYEVVATWDSVNSRMVATLIFEDPKIVGNWDVVYSWLLVEVKVSDLSKLDGTGYIAIGSTEVEGSNEIVFDTANLAAVAEGTIGTQYDKFRIPISEFLASSFNPGNIKRVTVSLGVSAQIVMKWRKARLVHLAESTDISSWFTLPYVEVVVDHMKVGSELVFFPLRVVFDESMAGFPIVMNDAKYSIMAVDSTGNPQYIYVEAFDKYTCVMWILAENVSDVEDTAFKIYYDKTGVKINTRYAFESLWVSKYPYILHMKESSNKIVDLSTHHNHCTIQGAKNVRVGGLRGLQFMGYPEYIRLPIGFTPLLNDIVGEGQLLFEVQPSVVSQADYACLGSIASEDNSNMQMVTVMWSGEDIVAQFSNIVDGRSTLVGSAPSTLEKAIIVVRWKSGVADIFVNGVKVQTGSIPILDYRVDIRMHLFGRTYNGEYGVEEQFEGIAYSAEALTISTSDEWITTDYWNRVGGLISITGVPDIADNYTQSVEVTILASPKDSTDHYQMEIVVHSGIGITRGNHAYLGLDCRVDLRDVLFVDSSNVPLYYTLLDTDGSTYATYVVRVLSIPDSGFVHLRMYYGFSDSPDLSDPVMVYDDYDGGEGNVLGRHWSQSGVATVSGGTILLDNNDLILRMFGVANDVEVMIRSKADQQDSAFIDLRDAIAYSNRLVLYNSDNVANGVFDKVVPDATKNGVSLGAIKAVTWQDIRDYHVYRIKRYTDKVVFQQDDSVIELLDPTYIPVVELFPGVCVWSDSRQSTLTMDWFAVRKSFEHPPLIVWWGDVFQKFGFRKTITVGASPDGEFDRYHIDIVIHRDKGVDGSSDIYIGAHCREDYRDILFTDDDGNILSHYVDTYTMESATVVVEFTNLPSTGSATFYMYYQSNYVGKVSDYKGTFGPGRVTTTNPPSITVVSGGTNYNDPSEYAYKRSFTVTSVTQEGWYQALCIVARRAGTSALQNVFVEDHIDSDAGDILITNEDGSEVIEYYVFVNTVGEAILRIYIYATPLSSTTYWMYYGKIITDNRRDPVVTIN